MKRFTSGNPGVVWDIVAQQGRPRYPKKYLQLAKAKGWLTRKPSSLIKSSERIQMRRYRLSIPS